MAPFYEVARLLYEGPWLAERYVAVQSLISSTPEAMHPVVREIIAAGARQTAADAFRAFYRLQELRRAASRVFDQVVALVIPTAPRTYMLEEVLADPIELNNRLGTYTNFVNLLDLCAIAVPAAISEEGTPFGVTLVAPAGCDAALASIARVFHADTELRLGGLDAPVPALASLPVAPARGEDRLVMKGHAD
jgi:allophanate hydrolase